MERYLIGIDVGGTNIKFMIMTDSFRFIAKKSIKTEAWLGYEEIIQKLIREIDGTFEEHEILKPNVASVAMGVPGIVDRKAKRTIHLNHLHWDGFDPVEDLGKYFNASTVLENDANIHALGEYWFGAGKNTESMVLLTLGTGVGGGIILDGKIFGGVHNLAAELGHMTIVADGGNPCLCGKRGCLEAYASGSALEWEAIRMMKIYPGSKLHKYKEENGGIYDNSMIPRGIEADDTACIRLMDWFTTYLSIGTANIMKILNPEVILIGGGVAEAGEVLIQPLNRKSRDRLFHERQYCPIKKAMLGGEAGMYGACALAGQKIGLDFSEIMTRE